ncbi:uncharacterized protein N7511_008216 [Penicillium nucicola]|uniref:uncharacterized protein n=1 Tax=Penicillium nucicola TaxID=1850975 RepID=UPI002545086F|nr:uncharacterized protein N7511_008216 [Penicillium nucicola]KAJ5754063.1 hypothetical protein N7511_008216 [Penicillium nucicola]
MPPKIKWDAAADQLLLAKILETHELTVDCAHVAEAWPGEPESKPTARAIRERISRIRDLARNTTTGLAGSQSPSLVRKPATPRKPTSAGKRTKASGDGSPSRKRKRIVKEEESVTEDIAEYVDEEKDLTASSVAGELSFGAEDL